jgi:altronate dehydratase small subunit
MSDPFLLLHPDDNVVVARSLAPEGTEVALPGGSIRLAATVPRAHKIACRAIAPGERILKYGMPIGIATEAIPAGAHVHIHNIRSAYTPTHALQNADGLGTGDST